MEAAIPNYGGSLLRSLDITIVDRLSLTLVELHLRENIEVPGKAIHFYTFVQTGIASMTTAFQDGSKVEVGMFGCESVIGISALMGTKQSLERVYT